jgi:hypothetical protein
MSVESLFDHYYERATIPIRNTEFSQEQHGSLDIRQVVEDDEFRQLDHKIVLKDGSAFSMWRAQDWGLGENSFDVTHFSDGIVKHLSIRYIGDAIKGLKVSLTRDDWLISDPDHRLPYIFGRSDMEAWYRATDFKMDLTKVRLAWDHESKHTFAVRDHGIDKSKAEHLYRGVEYRIELDESIRLTIDGKNPRRIDWRTEISADEVRALYDYASGESWIEGWDPVAAIIENGK